MVCRRTADPSECSWAALPVILAGAFMVVLDFFIVNVALPSLAKRLHAGSGSLEWVVAGYGLSFASFQIALGRLGDQFGRRRLYIVGLALFTLASAACGLAGSATELVLARVVQGLAAGIVMPQVLSITGAASLVALLLARSALPSAIPADTETASPATDEFPCRQLVETVTDNLGGVLPAGLREDYQTHVATCDGGVSQIAATIRALQAADLQPMPATPNQLNEY